MPFLIHLHITDALQEFLSLDDKLKLVEFDNKKLKEFTDFNNDIDETETFDSLHLFNKRLERFLEYLSNK